MKKTAQIISYLFHPYLLPLYGGGIIVSCSFLEILPLYFKLLIVGGIFLFSGILPLLFHLTLALFYLNKSDKKPYVRLTEILLYTVFLVFAAIYVHRLNLPFWAQGYLAGAAFSSALIWIINTIGWRISLYMTALGAILRLVITLPLSNLALPIGLFIALILVICILSTPPPLVSRTTLASTSSLRVPHPPASPPIPQVFKYHLLSL